MKQYRHCWSVFVLLLAMTAGCAGLYPPKTITQGDVAPKLKKRTEECARQFDQKRDAAEFEAAKTRWTQQRDLKGCREALEKLLSRRPQHRDAQILMVELLLTENDPQGAYQHALAALDADPNDPQVQFTVALTLDALGKSSDALAYYQRATKMDPQNADYVAAYETARDIAHQRPWFSATPMPEMLDSDEAAIAEAELVDYATATAPMPPSTEYASSPDDADTADSTGSVENNPARKLLDKGQAALAKESPQAALRLFRQAAAIKPDNPQIPISASAIALRAGHPEIAVELLFEAAKRTPKSAAVHRMLGAAHYRMGDYQSSQVSLRQALSLDKSSALSYLLMGCTLAKLGQREAAEVHFRQARAINPNYGIAR